jgi:hypothetical protein
LDAAVAQALQSSLGRSAIKATQGLGKTDAVCRHMVRANRSFLYMAPTTDNCVAALATYEGHGGEGGYAWLGRMKEDPNDPGKLMCINPDFINRKVAFLSNRNTEDKPQSLCVGCPLHREGACGYERQVDFVRDTQPKVIFAPHDFAHMPVPGDWHPDFVVIDEALRTAGIDTSIKVPFEAIPLNAQNNPKVLEAEIKKHNDDWLQISMRNDTKEIEQHVKKTAIMTAMLEGEKVALLKGEYVLPVRREYVHKDTPTLVIDGTFRQAIAEMYYGQFDAVTTINARRNVRITQVVGNMFTLNAVKKDQGQIQKHLRYLRRTCDAMVVEKEVRKIMGWEDDPDVMHFRNLRGRNEFKDKQAGVVAGYCSPPANAMELFAEVLTGKKPKGSSVKVTRYITDKEGRTLETQYHMHQDQVVQELISASREDELVQAPDRWRTVHHKGAPKEILICAPVVLDLPIDKVVLWNEVKMPLWVERVEQALDTGNGIVPDSAGKKHAMRPDVWDTIRKAKTDNEQRDERWFEGLQKVEFPREKGDRKAHFGWQRPK